MLIDTHCHLDATEFNADRDVEAQSAAQLGLKMIVVPAVDRENFQTVMTLSSQHPHVCYALGIHPMYVDNANPSDLALLKKLISEQLAMPNNKLVAVGEIGLDFFVTQQNRETQEYFFAEQLKIAKEYNLPVILHVRRAVDDVLKYLRKYKITGGIAHAFNGSPQQAEEFIKIGFKLGFGGALTFERALQLRKLVTQLPLEAIVLETDSPDMPPQWIYQTALQRQEGARHGRNEPSQLPRIAQVVADLRGITLEMLAQATSDNALAALPRIKL